MNTDQFYEIVEAENLDQVKFYIDQDYRTKSSCLMLMERAGTWMTFYVDERASIIDTSITIYDSYEEALIGLLERLRHRLKTRKQAERYR